MQYVFRRVKNTCYIQCMICPYFCIQEYMTSLFLHYFQLAVLEKLWVSISKLELILTSPYISHMYNRATMESSRNWIFFKAQTESRSWRLIVTIQCSLNTANLSDIAIKQEAERQPSIPLILKPLTEYATVNINLSTADT